MSDGTQIFEQAGLGGLSEIMVVPEEYCCPVFTDLPAEQLTLLGDTVGTGLAAGRDLVQIEPGWNVVVQGAGPVGMGAIQAARLANAGQVIVIEPIRARREIAMKVGGTIALDPNAEGNGLVAKIQSLCKDITDRRFAGGRISGGRRLAVPDGADFTSTPWAAIGSRPRLRSDPIPRPSSDATVLRLYPRGRPYSDAGRGLARQREHQRGAILQSRADVLLRSARRPEYAARHPTLREADRKGRDRHEVDGHENLSD